MVIQNRLLRGTVSLLSSLLLAVSLIVVLGAVLPILIYMYWVKPEYVGDGAVGSGTFVVLTFLAATGVAILPTVGLVAFVYGKLSPKT